MDQFAPRSAEELADTLAKAASAKHVIRLGGAFSKNRMAGPIAPAKAVISTSGMNRILQYEPRDLTISVEAGLRWADLTATLAANRQMIPLDPPFFDQATVGGVVASSCSGPRRRVFGTPRDVVIGMTFATLQGKLIKSGGMVVKNVAGLDMAKLMIGSFGTLAGIAVVNFKLAPVPPATRTFVLQFSTLQDAISSRNRILASVLQPWAIDLLNPAASGRVGLNGFCLLIEAAGSVAVLDRYSRELTGAEILDEDKAVSVWTGLRELTPRFLADHPEGGVLRTSTTLSGVGDAMRLDGGPALARAGNGVAYNYYSDAAAISTNGDRAAIEFAPEHRKQSLDLWPFPGSDFAMMNRVKQLFDPNQILNPGRLYGRI